MQEQGHAAKDPFVGVLLGFEVEGPDVGWTSVAGLIDGALVHVFLLQPVDGDGLDEHHRHGRRQFFQLGLGDGATGRVPPSPFHKDSMHVGP